MPQPKTWLSQAALISDLKECWHSRDQNIDVYSADWQTIIREAVSSNTFRAFQRLPARPSITFREWALDALTTRGYFEELLNLLTQEDYDRWLDRYVSDFRTYWHKAMNADISFGPSYKLPNLLMKLVCQRLPPADHSRVAWFLHVPLDSFTLVGIRKLVVLPHGRLIPRSATMRFIGSSEVYTCVRSQIRELAAKAGVPAIAYDYLAWDHGHR